jgi:hypothetical protein
MLVYLQGQCPCLTSVANKDVGRAYLLVNKIVLNGERLPGVLSDVVCLWHTTHGHTYEDKEGSQVKYIN